MGILGNYKFTNRHHPKVGVMSVFIGILSIISMILTIYFSYKARGDALIRYGMVFLLSDIFAVAGIVLGIIGMLQKDKFRFLPKLGIYLNVGVVALSVAIYLLGVYGI